MQPAPDGCHVPPSEAGELGLPPPPGELLVEQRGWCGICLEPMRADEIETWAVSRIRPEWAGGRRGRRSDGRFRADDASLGLKPVNRWAN